MKNYTLFTVIIAGLLLSGCSLLRPKQSATINIKTPDNKNLQVENPQTNKKLDLSNQNLQKIPEYVFNQKDLEELDVSNNRLTGAIQSQVGQLKNLRVLNASDNQMTGVPAEVGQLVKLQILNLSNNQITGLPNELGNLQNLNNFNISGNNYSEMDLSGILQKLPKDINIIR